MNWSLLNGLIQTIVAAFNLIYQTLVQYLRMEFLCGSQDGLPKIKDFLDLSFSSDDALFHQGECSDSYKKSQSNDLSQSVGTSKSYISLERYFNAHLSNGFFCYYKPRR